MRQTNKTIILAPILHLSVIIYAQKKDTIKSRILGNWKMTSSISKDKSECLKHYKVFRISFDKKDNYSSEIKFSNDNSKNAEQGKFKIDAETGIIYFYNVKLKVSDVKQATQANYEYKILEASEEKLVLRICLCGSNEGDKDIEQLNCKTVFKKIK